MLRKIKKAAFGYWGTVWTKKEERNIQSWIYTVSLLVDFLILLIVGILEQLA